MSKIILSDLRLAGSELFQDSESFLHELTEQSQFSIIGGRKRGFGAIVVIGDISIFAATVITANGNTINANTIGGANTVVG